MKEQFLKFVNELMKANPEKTKELMNEDVQAYLNMLNDVKDEKPVLTENGKVLLRYLQEHKDVRTWKAKDAADGLGVSSRGISGSFRKLVNDGFCEKLGQNPAVYCLTEKGTNFEIMDEE